MWFFWKSDFLVWHALFCVFLRICPLVLTSHNTTCIHTPKQVLKWPPLSTPSKLTFKNIINIQFVNKFGIYRYPLIKCWSKGLNRNVHLTLVFEGSEESNLCTRNPYKKLSNKRYQEKDIEFNQHIETWKMDAILWMAVPNAFSCINVSVFTKVCS